MLGIFVFIFLWRSGDFSGFFWDLFCFLWFIRILHRLIQKIHAYGVAGHHGPPISAWQFATSNTPDMTYTPTLRAESRCRPADQNCNQTGLGLERHPSPLCDVVQDWLGDSFSCRVRNSHCKKSYSAIRHHSYFLSGSYRKVHPPVDSISLILPPVCIRVAMHGETHGLLFQIYTEFQRGKQSDSFTISQWGSPLTAGAGGGCGRNVRNPFKIEAIATDHKWILEA